MLCDAVLVWTLYPRYRVKRRWKLKDVLGTWLRRLRSRMSKPPPAHQRNRFFLCLRTNRLVPLFGVVTCERSDLYSRIPSALLARFREPRFSFEDVNADSTLDAPR